MRYVTRSAICLAFTMLLAHPAGAQPSVLTQDYDNGRSGANLEETILTPSTVSSVSFGKLFSYPVDEEVFAQPLYVPGLLIGGSTHNVVFIATMGNSVYAYDADSAATSTAPLWSVNLGAGVPSSRFLWFSGSGVSRNGIYSTPVINPAADTIYVVTHTWNTAAQSETQQLHALSLTTGQEEFGGPVTITAPGFDPVLNEQRAGLLLFNGIVYVALASHADFRTNLSTLAQNNYYGMVLAYDAETLANVAVFNAESGGIGAAIWQGGRGLASDGTYIYAMTANAEKVGGTGVDYSESFVQLNPAALSVVSYYQDPDAACMNTLDLDLAASGPQVVPGTGTNLLLGGGKEGKVYALQLDQALSAQTPEYIWGTSNHPTLPAEGGTCVDTRRGGAGYLQGSDTAFWSNPGGSSYYYTLGSADELMSWQVAGNAFTQTSVDTPSNLDTNAMAVSANAGTNGILWTVSNETTGTAVVSAYNAVPSGGHLTLLWSSAQVPKRDSLGQQGRYSVPTISNGKVYVGSGSNQVAVYGLLPTAPSIQVTPVMGTMTFTGLDPRAASVFVSSVGGYTGDVMLTLEGLPPGFTYSFTPATVKLTAKATTIGSSLSISPAGGNLPLSDNYTVLVQGNGAGGSTAWAPIRLLTRNAVFSPVTKVGCNSSNQMDASLTWSINGSSVPTLWIQNASTGTAFPGSVWIDPAAPSGTTQTGYTIDNKKSNLVWLFDQSAGAPANFDNAMRYGNLGLAYSCP